MANNRWTERAQRALELAHEAASQLGHNYVGSEHILLGLLREETGIAARVLTQHGVTDRNLTASIVRPWAKGRRARSPWV